MDILDWKHWMVILVVIVSVFGTKKLKTLGGDFGSAIKGFREAMKGEQKAEQLPHFGRGAEKSAALR